MNRLSTGQTAMTCPNILLIVIDALRAEHLSCYGYHRPTSPNLDRFAECCVVYEAAISPAGWSLPSHASMFTGLYPSRHGAHDQHKYLSSEYPTLAELLRSHGYRTWAFCYNMYVGSSTGLDRGFEWFNQDYRRLPLSVRRTMNRANNGIARVMGRRDSGARYVNKQVSVALRRLQADDRPFFMFVHYEEPHALYRPPNKYNRYLPDGVSLTQAKRVNQDQWKYFVDPTLMDGKDFEILTALYDGEITYVDIRVAEVLDWLEWAGILDQTMVIITSDHGENIGDHQLMGHGYCLYDTLLHVPLVIHYPRGMTSPGRVAHQVQTLDLLPTILAMLGDTSSHVYRSLQGYNLLSSTGRDYTVAEQAHPDITTFRERFPSADVSRYDRALKMIRTERYKYIWSSDGNSELYDLRSDPDERCNIIGEHPDIADDLDRLLTEWRSSFEAASPTDQVPEFDEEVKARLRALGYLE